MWKPGREPEPAKVVDMRQLHIMDHRPFSKRCQSQFGGGRRHLQLLWWFLYRDRLYRPFRRVFNCPRGRHQEVQWMRGEQAGVLCNNCDWTRPMSEHELEMFFSTDLRIGPETKIIPPDWA